MVNSIGSSMNRCSTHEVPGGVFLDPDDFREPVFLATRQPCRELTVAEVGFVFHGEGVSGLVCCCQVTFGMDFLYRRLFVNLRRVGLTSVVSITTIKAPAFEGRGLVLVINYFIIVVRVSIYLCILETVVNVR